MLENDLNQLQPLQGRVHVRREREGQVRPRRQAAEHPHPLVLASYKVRSCDQICPGTSLVDRSLTSIFYQ